jgi:mRNA interferase MazF
MEVGQGEVYWVELEEPSGSEPGYRHPYIVVQNDVFNQSRIRTVVMCELTTNLNRAKVPGNVLLEIGEANLPRQSVVNVTRLVTMDRSQLGEFIGKVSTGRFQKIIAGIIQLITPIEMD